MRSMPVTPERRLSFEEAIAEARSLPAVLPGIVGLALVGSWARDSARADSDVDLVVLSEDPTVALETSSWCSVFGDDVALVRTSDFGAIQERRLRKANGLVIEVGIAMPSWARTNPVDAGTARVAGDGLVPLYDPEGLFQALLAVLNRGRTRPAPGLD